MSGTVEPAVSNTTNPGRILDLSWGIARTGTLTAALDLDVFSHIVAGSRTPASVASACGSDPVATATLLTCLASLGLLTVSDCDGHTSYWLAPDAEAFLVRGRPGYLGDLRHMHHAINFRLWPGLAETVTVGAPAEDLFGDDGSEVWTKVTPYLDQLANANATWLTGMLASKLPPGARVLDVGCGSGAYSRLLAGTFRDVRVTAVDRQEVADVAGRLAADAGLAAQIEVRGGDLRQVDWGRPYDLVLLSNVLHGYGETDCVELLLRARAALAPGGRIAVFEIVPDPERPLDNPVAAFFSLQMLMTSGGRAYTLEEYRDQMALAGLRSPMVTRCPAGPNTLLESTAGEVEVSGSAPAIACGAEAAS